MDGFNIVPVENNTNFKSSNSKSTDPISFDSGVEIIDEEKQKELSKQKESGGWLLFLAFACLISAFAYFGFLIFYRINMLNQVRNYSEQMRAIGKDIDLKEMQEFQAMDKTLQAINGRLNKHVLNAKILDLVNANIRKTLQVSEYRLDVKEKDVEVNITAISPSFRELAEQTEKLFELKEAKIIKSFSVTNLSFEAETKRLKFSLRLVFDKSNVTAAKLNAQTSVDENNLNI